MVRFLLKFFAFVLLLVLLGYGVWLLDPAMPESIQWPLLITNLVPLICLLIIFYGITRRIGLSFLFVGVIGWLLFSINEHKLLNLEEPLIFADIYLVPQMISGWTLMQLYVDHVWLIGSVVAFLVLFFLLYRYERPALKWHFGIVVLLFGVGSLGFLVLGKQGPATYYGSRSNDSHPWTFSSLAEKQGLLASLVSGARLTRFAKPAFNAQTIETFLVEEGVSQQPEQYEPRPDIVLWLSESFFDTQVLNNIEPCNTWVLFCELQAKGVTAQMGVSTFGGNTIRTEFEVLTGVPFSMLGGHDYPYISAVNTQTDSIAWQLQKQGYKTIAVHPHYRTFWQRHRALPLLGFQQFDGDDTFTDAKNSGYYIADRYLNDRVINYLASANEPTFVFAISMENHGPWGTGTRHSMDQERVRAIPVPKGLKGEAARAWQEYVYHGENALNALEELYAYVQTRERPTLVIFFGDHLPGLNIVFDRLEFKDGRPGPSQNVPVIALANYPLQADWLPGRAHDLGVWMLHLAGQLGDGNYREMNEALSRLRNVEEPSSLVREALEAMQARQLHWGYVR